MKIKEKKQKVYDFIYVLLDDLRKVFDTQLTKWPKNWSKAIEMATWLWEAFNKLSKCKLFEQLTKTSTISKKSMKNKKPFIQLSKDGKPVLNQP